MGPTSACKTTIGRLFVENIPTIKYDGDKIQLFYGDKRGFRSKDRLRAVSSCAYLANKAVVAGLSVVASALTANVDPRAYIRENVPNLFLAYDGYALRLTHISTCSTTAARCDKQDFTSMINNRNKP